MIGSATKEMVLKEVIKKSLTYFESVSEKHSKSLLASNFSSSFTI